MEAIRTKRFECLGGKQFFENGVVLTTDSRAKAAEKIPQTNDLSVVWKHRNKTRTKLVLFVKKEEKCNKEESKLIYHFFRQYNQDNVNPLWIYTMN